MEAKTFCTKVKQRLSEMNKKQGWLSEQTGIILQSIRDQISKQRLPSLDDTMKILSALDLTWEEFELYPEKRLKPDNFVIPVMDQVFSAGRGQFVPEEDTVKDYITLPKNLQRYADNLAAVYVRGDSMEPTLFNDDIIVTDNLGYDGEDGIYTILYKGSGYVKRLQRTFDGIKIISDNKHYEPMNVTAENEDFKIIGRVRCVLHEF